MLTTPKLGLIGHKEDRLGRTLKLKDFIKRDFAYPAACDLTFGMEPDTDPLGNQDTGLCALAGPGHFARWEDQLCGRPLRVTEAHVRREYKEMVPDFDPAIPETDTGLYALDVFVKWRKVGLFGLPPIKSFFQVDYFDPEQIAASTFLGGVFFCFNLPNEVADGSIFEASTWAPSPNGSGMAGGHLIWDRNSWGERKYPTQPFIARYCFDAFAVVSKESIKPDGRAYSGLDLGGLQEALTAVTA
jgi:hypothetical protein